MRLKIITEGGREGGGGGGNLPKVKKFRYTRIKEGGYSTNRRHRRKHPLPKQSKCLKSTHICILSASEGPCQRSRNSVSPIRSLRNAALLPVSRNLSPNPSAGQGITAVVADNHTVGLIYLQYSHIS